MKEVKTCMSVNMYQNSVIICPYCLNENSFDAVHCFACGNVIPKLQIVNGQAIPSRNIGRGSGRDKFPYSIVFFLFGMGLFLLIFSIIYVVF